jgi:ACS family tartrate transporter-like MFS transporter
MFLSGAGLAAGIAWINSIGNLGGFFGLIAAIVCALFLHIPSRTPLSASPVGAPAG